MAGGPKQRKLIAIDPQLLSALHELSRTGGRRLDDLFDQALRDLLKKSGQPLNFEDALKQSTRRVAANDAQPRKVSKRRR